LVAAFEVRRDQTLLRREMIVQRPARDAGFACDRLQADRRDAALVEEPVRRGDQRRAGGPGSSGAPERSGYGATGFPATRDAMKPGNSAVS
jgi:hypothetical protein